jgi:protein-disulfide isomerase
MIKSFILGAVALIIFSMPLAAAETKKTPAPTLSIGRPDAPVVIDEYASLGCSHCADFHNHTLAQLKATFIESGRVRLVYHYFPLDKASVDAALLVECLPNHQKWQMVDLLYRDQANWAHDKKYVDKLHGYGAMLGLPAKTIKACLNDTKKRDAILHGRVDAAKKLKIESTPTFIFNGSARQMGTKTFDEMANIINKM